MLGDKTQRKLFLSWFEWKARHSSAPIPKCQQTEQKAEKRRKMRYSERHILRGVINPCPRVRCQLCFGGVVGRCSNNPTTFVSFSGGARSNLTTPPFCPSNFFSAVFLPLFLFLEGGGRYWLLFCFKLVPLTFSPTFFLCYGFLFPLLY